MCHYRAVMNTCAVLALVLAGLDLLALAPPGLIEAMVQRAPTWEQVGAWVRVIFRVPLTLTRTRTRTLTLTHVGADARAPAARGLLLHLGAGARTHHACATPSHACTMPTPYHASLRPSRAISRHLAPSRARCTGCSGRSTRWRGRRGKPPTARAERPRRPTGRWPTRWSAPTRSSTSSPWSASSRRIRRLLPRSARPHDVTSHEPRGPPGLEML